MGQKNKKGFSILELVIVAAIISLLATIAIAAFKRVGINARNESRKSNLIQVSKALELYFSNNGSYPDTFLDWRGACTTRGSFPDTGDSAWIPNFSSYMRRLPHDPNTNKPNYDSADPNCASIPGDNCYLYRSNGTDYKLLALCIPEGAMSASDPFRDPIRPVRAWQVSSKGAAAW